MAEVDLPLPIIRSQVNLAHGDNQRNPDELLDVFAIQYVTESLSDFDNTTVEQTSQTIKQLCIAVGLPEKPKTSVLKLINNLP